MKAVVIFLATLAVCYGSKLSWKSLAANSCEGICGDNSGSVGCMCNSVCSDFGDCCPDYDTLCFTCAGRCAEGYLYSKPCQCNVDCPSFGNCCADYDSTCGGTGSGATNAEIIAVTDELYALGASDFVGSSVTYDTAPPGPLFTSADPAAFSGASTSALLALRDDYDPYTSDPDTISPADKSAFLDAIMATSIMARTETFLTDKGYITEPLRDVIDFLFFTLYPRDASTLGSSGFEHSFMGEIDDGVVKGFHNWVSFYEEEQVGNLVYTTFTKEIRISTDLSLLQFGMTWYGYTKSITSMWVGSTPELELAYYTICFLARPNSLCDVSSNGVPYKIQTYTQAYNGMTLVGSAYPYLP